MNIGEEICRIIASASDVVCPECARQLMYGNGYFIGSRETRTPRIPGSVNVYI